MPLIPPTNKPAAMSQKQAAKPKAKPRPRRTGTRGSLNISPDELQDTPTPPTEPVAQPEPELREEPLLKSAAKPRAGSIEARLTEAFSSAAIIPTFAGDQYSAYIIATRSQRFAHDLAELAKVNPRIKKMLENLLDGGVYGGVMFSGAALLLPILWGHGVLPNPGIDPFSAFYEPVPPTVVPRSARRAGSDRSKRVAPDPARSPASERAGNAASDTEPPIGVVTVRPGAHPPVPPAAA